MTTAFKTGNFQSGQTIDTVSRQWLARPADEKFTSLTDLRDAVAERRNTAFERKIHTKGIEFLAPEPQKIEDTHDSIRTLRAAAAREAGRNITSTKVH